MGGECEYWFKCALDDLQRLYQCLANLAGAGDGTADLQDDGWDVTVCVCDIAALDAHCIKLARERAAYYCSIFKGEYPSSNQVMQALHLHVSKGLQLYLDSGGNSALRGSGAEPLIPFKSSARRCGLVGRHGAQADSCALDANANASADAILSIIVCRLYLDIICTLHQSLVVAGWRRQLQKSLNASAYPRDTPCVTLDQVLASRNWFILLDSKLSSLDICYWKCRCELYNLQLFAFWFALKDAWWLYSIPNWLETKMPFLSQVPRPFNKRRCSVTEFVTVIMRLREVVGNVDDLFFNDHVGDADEDCGGDGDVDADEDAGDDAVEGDGNYGDDSYSDDYSGDNMEPRANAQGGTRSPIADYYSFFKFKQPFGNDDDDDDDDYDGDGDGDDDGGDAAKNGAPRKRASARAFKGAADVDAGFEVVYTASGGRRSSNNIWVDMKHQGGIDPKWQDFNDVTFDLETWHANAQVFNLSDDESLPSLGEITNGIDKASRLSANDSSSAESAEYTSLTPPLQEQRTPELKSRAAVDACKENGTGFANDDGTLFQRGSSFSILDSFQHDFDPEMLLSNVKRLIFDHNGWFLTTTSALVHCCCAALSESFCLCAHANPSYNTTPWIMAQLDILENLDHEAWNPSMMMSTAITGLYQRLVLLVADVTIGWLEPRLNEAPFLPWPMLDQYDSCGNIYTLVSEVSNEEAPVYKDAIVVEVVARMILKLHSEAHLRKITQERLVYKCMALNEWVSAIGADDIVVIKRLVQLVDALKHHYKHVTIQQVGQLVHDFWYSSRIKTTLPRHGKAAAIASPRGACAFEKFGIEAYLCSVLGGYNTAHFNVWLGQGQVHCACIHGSLVLIFKEASRLQPVAFIDLVSVTSVRPFVSKARGALTPNSARLVILESCTMFQTMHSQQVYHTCNSAQFQWYRQLEKILQSTRQDSPKIHWPRPLV